MRCKREREVERETIMCTSRNYIVYKQRSNGIKTVDGGLILAVARRGVT